MGCGGDGGGGGGGVERERGRCLRHRRKAADAYTIPRAACLMLGHNLAALCMLTVVNTFHTQAYTDTGGHADMNRHRYTHITLTHTQSHSHTHRYSHTQRYKHRNRHKDMNKTT